MAKLKRDSPIFIIGNPRSGTSLLRLMLTCHSNIIIPPESHFFLWLESKYRNWDFKNNLNDFLDDLYDSTKFETWHINRDDLNAYLIESRVNSYTSVISSIYLYYGFIHNKKDIIYWGDKNKLWKEQLPKIIEFFPETKFIHLIRDGRDVACSFIALDKNKSKSKYAPKLPSEIGEIANRWNLNIETILKFFEDNKNLSLHTIKYEDLILNTEDELNKICKYLKLPFDSKMINYLELNEKEMYEPLEFLDWKEKLKRMPDRSNIGKYKRILTTQDQKLFEEITSVNLRRFGYEQ